ncbi:putative cation-transporting ATPase 13A4 [Lissotriton helveticus]
MNHRGSNEKTRLLSPGEGSCTPGIERNPENHRHALLNQGEENEMQLFGYKTHPCRRVLCIIGHILSLGLLLFLFYWKPEWEVWANCTPSTLKDADVLLLRTMDDFKTYSRKKVRWIYLPALLNSSRGKRDYLIAADKNAIINRAIMKPEHKVRFVQVQKIRYVWDSSENQFTKIGALEDRYSCTDMHTKFGSGFTSEEQEIRKLICGPNAIEVEVVPFWKLLFKEVLNPFYLFQALAMALWLYLENYEIPAVIIFMTVVSVIVTTYDLHKSPANTTTKGTQSGGTPTPSVDKKKNQRIRRLKSKTRTKAISEEEGTGKISVQALPSSKVFRQGRGGVRGTNISVIGSDEIRTPAIAIVDENTLIDTTIEVGLDPGYVKEGANVLEGGPSETIQGSSIFVFTGDYTVNSVNTVTAATIPRLSVSKGLKDLKLGAIPKPRNTKSSAVRLTPSLGSYFKVLPQVLEVTCRPQEEIRRMSDIDNTHGVAPLEVPDTDSGVPDTASGVPVHNTSEEIGLSALLAKGNINEVTPSLGETPETQERISLEDLLHEIKSGFAESKRNQQEIKAAFDALDKRVDLLSERTENLESTLNIVWEAYKAYLRGYITNRASYRGRIYRAKIANIEKDIASLDQRIGSGNGTITEQEQRKDLKEKLDNILQERVALRWEASKLSNFEYGESAESKAEAYFFLKGESVPVTKMPLPEADSSMPWKEYSGEDYKRHILFCGTNLIQSKASASGPARAVVLQTGFNTAKGDLVRCILYSRPVNFKLHRDAVRFLMCLAVFGVVSVIYSIVIYSRAGKPTEETILMGISVLTIAVPPSLMAALAVGVMYAQKRLKNKGIFCFSPQRINLWGQVNIVCFDKTGTLTEDALDLWGLIPFRENSFQAVYRFSSGTALPWGPLLGALASCHSLMVIDGKLQGDPLDLKMFEGTFWEVVDQNISEDVVGKQTSLIFKPGPKATKVPVEGLAIVHQFPFSSGLQRMSVVTQVVGGDQCLVFMKGAPEKVISFCRPETVPSNFSSELQIYTMQGFRVIGLAYKALPSEMHPKLRSLARGDVESNLEFLGLMVMENQLKPETKPVLEELLEAKIRTVMVTGDNLQTALTVAKHSGMIPESSRRSLVSACGPEGCSPASITLRVVDDQKSMTDVTDEMFFSFEEKLSNAMQLGNYYFAMDGKTYHVILQHFYGLLPKFLLNAVIFARMSPRQKASLVEELIKLDYVVGMCGDGANDCGALRTAHVGISLSEQEASMASPFTSRTPNIKCVSEVIKEGRCALVTSFAVFKFMTMYAAASLINQLLLFWHFGLLGRCQYLIIDVAITTGVCLTISLNGANPKLSSYRPPNRLMSPPFVLSLCLHALFAFIIQIVGYASVLQQPWYNATNIHSACLTGNLNVTMSVYRSYEGTTIYPLYEGTLIIAAFVFAKGKPFRKPLYTNYLFSLLLIGLITMCIFLIFGDFEGLYIVSELVCVPTLWRVYLFIAVVVHFFVCYGVEEGIIENRALWVWIKKKVNYKSKSQYQKLQRLLERAPQWPPINQTIYPDSPVTETDPESESESEINPLIS